MGHAGQSQFVRIGYRKLEGGELIPAYNIPNDLWIFPNGGKGRVFTGPGGHRAGDYGYPIYQKLPEEDGEPRAVPLSLDSEVPVGTEVLIPKGVNWNSTHPSLDSGIMCRYLRVKVQTATSRFEDRLTWAGTAGFWKWCKKDECFYFPNQI